MYEEYYLLTSILDLLNLSAPLLRPILGRGAVRLAPP